MSREFFDHRARSFVVYDSLSISNHARAWGMGFRYYLPPKKMAEAEEILKFAQCVRPGGDFWESPEVRGVRSRRGLPPYWAFRRSRPVGHLESALHPRLRSKMGQRCRTTAALPGNNSGLSLY